MRGFFRAINELPLWQQLLMYVAVGATAAILFTLVSVVVFGWWNLATSI